MTQLITTILWIENRVLNIHNVIRISMRWVRIVLLLWIEFWDYLSNFLKAYIDILLNIFILSFWIRNLNYLIWYVSLKLLYLNFYDEHVVEIWKYFEWGKIVTMFRILGWMLFLPNGNLLQNVSLK